MADTFNFTAPTGWNKWIHVNNAIGNLQLPDAEFPFLYTPSGGFRARSWINNCLTPWLVTPDAFTLFEISGGTSGTLIGSLNGIAVVNLTANIATAHQTFGVGRGAEAPQMGYCIGNKFKQHVYVRYDIYNDGFGRIVIPYSGIDLLQNSRFKRACVNHGTVVRYTNTSGSTINAVSEHLLTLDIVRIDSPIQTDIDSVISDKITITNTKGVTTTVNVLGLKSNWDVVISDPSIDIDSNSFYQINKTWIIEDPYLLSGFWIGRESDNRPLKPCSPYNLYTTTHNSPYEEGKFLGVYIWEKDTFTDTISVTATISTTTMILPLQPSAGSSMEDLDGYTWAFMGLGNNSEMKPVMYPSDDRYRVIKLDAPDLNGNIIQYINRIKATSSEYSQLISTKPSYLRVEIATGGYISRHNWYAPCLKGSYLESNGKFYKIISHITFNIIDINYISVDGITTFNPSVNQNYSIVNQYAWFITEDYDGRVDANTNTGIFRGTVSSPVINGKVVKINTLGDTYPVQWKRNGLSFIDRYQKNIALGQGFKKMFSKFNKWKLVINSSSEYNIKSVNFSQASNSSMTIIPYPITVELISPTDISNNSSAYIIFDDDFETFGTYSKEAGYNLNVDYTTGGTSQGYINSNLLCMDGQYDSNPYKLDIANGDRIGFTDGYLFGIGSAASVRYSQTMFLTTPRTTRGIASLFHDLRYEDWVAYEDAVTGKLTIRRGSLDFTEYPMKQMIVIGKTQRSVTSSATTNTVKLDTSFELLRRIGFKFISQGNGDDLAVLFAVGTIDNIYGFYISGDGLSNLQLYSKQGKKAGEISSDFYKGDGYPVSPVYLYKPNYYQNLNEMSVDIGTSTKNGAIYIIDDQVSHVWTEYVKENQTLTESGYYDLIRLANGENLFIYGGQPKSFKIGNNINNSNKNSTLWNNQNAVMIIGTYDDSYIWSTPLVGRVDDIDNIKQYPLMIMNAVDYLGCLYNSVNETICIFVRCSNKVNGTLINYLGCYIIPIYNLQYKKFLCTPILPSVSSSFLWKPPLLPDSFINNTLSFWTDSQYVVKDDFSFIPSTDTSPQTAAVPDYTNTSSIDIISVVQENFIRVMGPNNSNSQIHNANEFGIISTAILPDGLYAVFYDTDVGVKAIFSADNGNRWLYSNTIFARNAQSALLIDHYLFYITTEGVMVKNTQLMDFYNAKNVVLMDAGNARINEEIQLQKTLDKERQVLIGSGAIEFQRLSGYATPEGLIKIFFYDQKNLLKCMESKDSFKWNVTNNF